MEELIWTKYDREDKANTAPPEGELVWIVEGYEPHVTLGLFDGFTMRMWYGTDDCHVGAWASITPPSLPEGMGYKAYEEDE